MGTPHCLSNCQVVFALVSCAETFLLSLHHTELVMPLPIKSCHVPQISLTCCNGCCDTCTLHFYGMILMVTTTWNKGAGKTLRYSVARSWIPVGCDSICPRAGLRFQGISVFCMRKVLPGLLAHPPRFSLWWSTKVVFICAKVLFGHIVGPEYCLGTLHCCGSERSVQGTSRNCHCLLGEVWLWSISAVTLHGCDGALIFLSSAEGGLCVVSSVHSSIFQRHNLQDKSVSICAASLWLQLEFVENGPMAKECGQGRGSRNASC